MNFLDNIPDENIKEYCEAFVDAELNKIIDECHDNFTPITDEKVIYEDDVRCICTRDFLHNVGSKFRMEWEVIFGDEDTVRTIFRPAVPIGFIQETSS